MSEGTKLNTSTNFDVMSELLQLRYDNYRRHNAITHISTNINPKDLKKYFDDRIVDRFNECFNVIEFSGKSFRK